MQRNTCLLQEDVEQAAASALPPADTGAAPQQLAAALRSQQAAAADEQEDDVSQHPRHVFVFSTAGKPIYSYRGDESRLAGLMATAEAILSVAHSKGHTLKHVRWVLVVVVVVVAMVRECWKKRMECACGCSQTDCRCCWKPSGPDTSFSYMPAGRGSMCLPSWSARLCAWWGCRRWQSRPPYCACRYASVRAAIKLPVYCCIAQGKTAPLRTTSSSCGAGA
jgi:hypothetical protein